MVVVCKVPIDDDCGENIVETRKLDSIELILPCNKSASKQSRSKQKLDVPLRVPDPVAPIRDSVMFNQFSARSWKLTSFVSLRKKVHDICTLPRKLVLYNFDRSLV
jgi:hypothetical protein